MVELRGLAKVTEEENRRAWFSPDSLLTVEVSTVPFCFLLGCCTSPLGVWIYRNSPQRFFMSINRAL